MGFNLQLVHSNQVQHQSRFNQVSEPEITLYKGTTTIGRAKSNIMAISEEGVSYYHAMIITMNKVAYIHDLGSLSGVYVNGQPVQYTILHLGDQVKIGEFCFKVADIK